MYDVYDFYCNAHGKVGWRCGLAFLAALDGWAELVSEHLYEDFLWVDKEGCKAI